MATEAELIRKTREAGKAYLKKNPGAFGGGIDADTGIRRTSSGKRISVTTPEEEAAGVQQISKAEAERIEVKEEESRIQKLKAASGSQQTRELKNVSGETQIQTTYYTDTGRVFEIRNLQTGRVETRTFEKEPGERFTRQTGGLISYPVTSTINQGDLFIDKYASYDYKNYQDALRLDRETRFRIGLSDYEKTLPLSQVIKSRGKESLVGIGQFGIGVVEGSVNIFSNLGSSKIKEGESIGLFGVKDSSGNYKSGFKFKGKLGEIRDMPATTGSLITKYGGYASLAGAAGAQFTSTASSAGLGTATRQVVYQVSPFKIQTGVFGPLSSQTKIDKLNTALVSGKSNTESGLIRRDIFGKAIGEPLIDIRGVQLSKIAGGKEIGSAIIRTSAPQTTIGYGTVTTAPRVIITRTPFISDIGKASQFSGGIGVQLQGVSSSATKGLTTTIFDTAGRTGQSILIRTGSISQTKGKVDIFKTGQARRFIDTRTGTSGLRIYETNTRGIEINLGKLGETGSQTYFSPGRQGIGTSLKTSSGAFFAAPKISALSTQKSTPLIIPRVSRPRPIQTTKSPTQIFQTQQTIPKVKTEQITRLIPEQRIDTRTISVSSSRTRQIPTQQTRQIPIQELIQVPRTRQIPRQRTVPRARQVSEYLYSSPTITPFGIRTRNFPEETGIKTKIPSFKFPPLNYGTSRKKKRRSSDLLLIPQGYTSKELGLKKLRLL